MNEGWVPTKQRSGVGGTAGKNKPLLAAGTTRSGVWGW